MPFLTNHFLHINSKKYPQASGGRLGKYPLTESPVRLRPDHFLAGNSMNLLDLCHSLPAGAHWQEIMPSLLGFPHQLAGENLCGS